MPANDPTGLRFGEAAQAYERGRPEYPGEVVDWLLGESAGRVVDLGAGTGKLTRAIVPRAGSVIAVEPDATMRHALSHRLPGVPALAGTAEHIPLPDGSVDVVVVGQAWHWVDPARGSAEVARVLRPGGHLGLVWNDRDADDPWIDRLTALLVEYGTSPDADYGVRVDSPFGALEEHALSWTHTMTPDDVVDMVVSRSYVIALPAPVRAELVDRVRALAVDGVDPATGMVPVRYVTHGYRTVRP